MKCKTGKHDWPSEDEANRCCNGWVRVLVPWLCDQPYNEHGQGFWAYELVREDDQEELARLEALRPIMLRGNSKGPDWTQ